MNENLSKSDIKRIGNYIIGQIQNKEIGYKARATINANFFNLKQDVGSRATAIQLEEVKTIASNAQTGMNPMGKATNEADLNSKPKRDKDSYFRLDTVDENNNPYIWRYDAELGKWINTFQITYVKDALTKEDLTKTLGKDFKKAPSEGAVQDHFIHLGLYDSDQSLIPDNSKFDENTFIEFDDNGKGVKAGEFEIRWIQDNNNFVKNQEDKLIVSLNSSGGRNPALWMLNVIDPMYIGQKVVITFVVKKISGSENSLSVTLNSTQDRFLNVALNESEQKVESEIDFGNNYPDNRLMFLIVANEGESKDLTFEISHLELKLKKGAIQQSQENSEMLQTIGSFTPNLLPEDSLLNKETPLIVDENKKGIGAGIFDIRYATDANNYIDKNQDDSFRVWLNNTGGINPALYAVNKISTQYKGKMCKVKFDIKKIAGNVDVISLILNGTATETLTIPLTEETQTIEQNIFFGNNYPDNRLMFFLPHPQADGKSLVFDIKNLSIVDATTTLTADYANFKQQEDQKHKESEGRITSTEDRLKAMEQTKGINLTLTVFLALIVRLIRNQKGVISLVFSGDSWVHSVGANGNGLIGFCKYITRMLQKKYGYAGLGWFDFARVNGTDMECADDEMTTYVTTGSIRYVEKTPDALGLAHAHAVMSQGATYSIAISDQAPTDKANILFYKGAKFSVSINGGVAREVVANNVDGWQNIQIEENITSIVITALTDNTIVFGIDFSYGDKGIKVHKLGCRGLNTRQPLTINIDHWTEGLSKLDIDFYSILLGTNDRTLNFPPEESASNLKKIVDNVKKVHPYIDYAFICPSETKAGTGKFDIREYGLEYSKVAIDNNFTFLNLYPVFGTREQIIHLDTFEDYLHPTKDGGYMISEYIFKKLFEYEQY